METIMITIENIFGGEYLRVYSKDAYNIKFINLSKSNRKKMTNAELERSNRDEASLHKFKGKVIFASPVNIKLLPPGPPSNPPSKPNDHPVS